MNTIFLALRIILAGTFGLAGVAKLRDYAGSRQAMIAFGVPPGLARLLAVPLPLIELSTAIALIFPNSAWWGSLSALALLLIFTAAIAINLIRGRTPECHCFGQLHSKPIGSGTLVRNGLLAGCAAIALWERGPGLSVIQGFREAVRTDVLLGALVIAMIGQSWLLWHLFGQHGRMLTRMDEMEVILKESGLLSSAHQISGGLPVGTLAPEFDSPTLAGESVTLRRLRESNNPVLLIFTDPGCSPCNALLPDIARWQRDYAGILTIALVSRGTVEANRAKLDGQSLEYVLLQRDHEVSDLFLAAATPSAVVVSAAGSIASQLVMGERAIADLLASGIGNARRNDVPAAQSGLSEREVQQSQDGLKIGQRVPQLRLMDLEGLEVEMNRFVRKSTVIVFWNPSCGFCRKMLPELKAWEQQRSDNSPEILVVSTGSVAANRAMEMKSTVLLDHHFAAGRLFGAGGTPSAVLIDSAGNVASAVAMGSEKVFALAALQSTEPLEYTNT